MCNLYNSIMLTVWFFDVITFSIKISYRQKSWEGKKPQTGGNKVQLACVFGITGGAEATGCNQRVFRDRGSVSSWTAAGGWGQCGSFFNRSEGVTFSQVGYSHFFYRGGMVVFSCLVMIFYKSEVVIFS